MRAVKTEGLPSEYPTLSGICCVMRCQMARYSPISAPFTPIEQPGRQAHVPSEKEPLVGGLERRYYWKVQEVSPATECLEQVVLVVLLAKHLWQQRRGGVGRLTPEPGEHRIPRHDFKNRLNEFRDRGDRCHGQGGFSVRVEGRIALARSRCLDKGSLPKRISVVTKLKGLRAALKVE